MNHRAKNTEPAISNRSRSTDLFVSAVALASVMAMGIAARSFHITDPTGFSVLLIMALISSRLKLELPGMDGSMSVNLPFVLLAIARLSFGEAILIAALSTLVQCVPPSRSMKPIQVIFNICNLLNAAGLAALVFHYALSDFPTSMQIAAATGVFFLADTIPVAIIIAVAEGKPGNGPIQVWRELFSLTFNYFVLSAGAAGLVLTAESYMGVSAFALLPLMFAVHSCYRRFLPTAGRLSQALQSSALSERPKELEVES